MIFPEEYKFVGIKDREHRGEPVYFATEFLISRDGPRLYRVKSRGSGFMREVEQLELIASGAEIEFYPERVDTRNRASLIDLADSVCRSGKANTVVFQGPDEHITFVKDPDPGQILTIEVLDVSPPDPPWLIHVLEEFGGMRNPRRPDGSIQAKHPGSAQVRGRKCLLPLPGLGPGAFSGLGPGDLHDFPRIVGCEVSREIFLANNPGHDYEFVNICPLQCPDARL